MRHRSAPANDIGVHAIAQRILAAAAVEAMEPGPEPELEPEPVARPRRQKDFGRLFKRPTQAQIVAAVGAWAATDGPLLRAACDCDASDVEALPRVRRGGLERGPAANYASLHHGVLPTSLPPAAPTK